MESVIGSLCVTAFNPVIFYCIHTNESESTTDDPETKSSHWFQRERFFINTNCNLQNRSEVVTDSERLLSKTLMILDKKLIL